MVEVPAAVEHQSALRGIQTLKGRVAPARNHRPVLAHIIVLGHVVGLAQPLVGTRTGFAVINPAIHA